MAEHLDNVLVRVTELLDLGLPWQQTEERVQHILETKDQQHNLFELIRQNSKNSNSRFFIKRKQKYPLLLGFCYKLGIGTVKDEKKAFKHWKQDTTSYGHYLVGRSYFYGWGVVIDYDKALLEFKLSTDAGNPSGQNILGVCYETGKGVEMDLEKAVQWYQKSAEAGNSNAQNYFAFCYENGKGVEMDLEKAVQWYQKSAEAGNSEAQRNLALCYENGKGVEMDLEKAFQWYQKFGETLNLEKPNEVWFVCKECASPRYGYYSCRICLIKHCEETFRSSDNEEIDVILR